MTIDAFKEPLFVKPFIPFSRVVVSELRIQKLTKNVRLIIQAFSS
jgi:hypothetical protein